MQKYIYDPIIPKSSPSVLKNLTENDCFLDIETTGLSSRKNHIYLIGLGFYSPENNSYQVIQYFAESRSDEKEMLSTFLSEWSEEYRIITFNGNRFDLPFLYDRLKICGFLNTLFQNETLDLYKEIKPLKKILNLPSLRQVTIQAFLGLHREDKEDGGSLIPIYQHYEKNPNPDDLHLLLLHNREDVEGMVDLLQIQAYKHLADWVTDVHITESNNRMVLFEGKLENSIPSSIRYQEENFYMIMENSRIKGAFPDINSSIPYYYPNPEDYVYLPLEDKCIPKILASSIPKSRYRKAKKEEAYQKIPVSKLTDELLLKFLKNYLGLLV